MKLNLVRNLIKFKHLSILSSLEVAPLIYKQMYNFSANIKGKVLPLMYTLLPNKTERIDLKLFKNFLRHSTFFT